MSKVILVLIIAIIALCFIGPKIPKNIGARTSVIHVPPEQD